MSAFLYGIRLQFKLDIRSKTLLVTCYVVPLLFFAIMGGIFTSLMPEAKYTLIQSMTVMGISMGALIGLPPSLVEIYGSDMKKMYKANGVPLFQGLASIVLSTFIHLLIMSIIILAVAPIVFDANIPSNLLLYFSSVAIFIAVSLSIGSILGLLVKNQAKLTMFSQLVFLPSIMLSGIMFSVDLLPKVLKSIGMVFPAAWGYKLLVNDGHYLGNLIPLFVILLLSIVFCSFLLKKIQSE